jgi:hypothetical protein
MAKSGQMTRFKGAAQNACLNSWHSPGNSPKNQLGFSRMRGGITNTFEQR